jgi:beta-alanine--pyruvate transaminase
LEPVWTEAVHSLKGLPNVLDIRNVGLTAAIDLAGKPDAPGKRGFEAMDRAFHECDLLLRLAGDTIILTPPLILTEAQIGEIVERTAKAIKSVA